MFSATTYTDLNVPENDLSDVKVHTKRLNSLKKIMVNL